jgi:hypothetical protein
MEEKDIELMNKMNYQYIYTILFLGDSKENIARYVVQAELHEEFESIMMLNQTYPQPDPSVMYNYLMTLIKENYYKIVDILTKVAHIKLDPITEKDFYDLKKITDSYSLEDIIYCFYKCNKDIENTIKELVKTKEYVCSKCGHNPKDLEKSESHKS